MVQIHLPDRTSLSASLNCGLYANNGGKSPRRSAHPSLKPAELAECPIPYPPPMKVGETFGARAEGVGNHCGSASRSALTLGLRPRGALLQGRTRAIKRKPTKGDTSNEG